MTIIDMLVQKGNLLKFIRLDTRNFLDWFSVVIWCIFMN